MCEDNYYTLHVWMDGRGNVSMYITIILLIRDSDDQYTCTTVFLLGKQYLGNIVGQLEFVPIAFCSAWYLAEHYTYIQLAFQRS